VVEINVNVVMDKHIVSRDEIMPALHVMFVAVKNWRRGPEYMRIRVPDRTMIETFDTEPRRAMGIVVPITVGGE
jgi:hypothetical protein